jgi:hypothetical protein
MNRNAELKADYQQNGHRLRTMGVYQVLNRTTGKRYLDGSLNLEGAMARERLWLGLGNHLNRQLQQDWQACGAEAFTIEILETLTPTDDARDYAGEVALLLEAWKAQLEPYGDKGYLPVPRR